jgi:hypothetical protein
VLHTGAPAAMHGISAGFDFISPGPVPTGRTRQTLSTLTRAPVTPAEGGGMWGRGLIYLCAKSGISLAPTHPLIHSITHSLTAGGGADPGRGPGGADPLPRGAGAGGGQAGQVHHSRGRGGGGEAAQERPRRQRRPALQVPQAPCRGVRPTPPPPAAAARLPARRRRNHDQHTKRLLGA